MRHWITALGVAVAFAAGSAPLAADDAPATVPAAKDNVAFTLDVAGTFDATSAVEVVLKMQVFGDELEIEECTPGGPVEKGAPLVRFKAEKFDDAYRAAERDLGIARIAFSAQSEEQRRQIETTAVAVTRVEFDAKTAQQALDQFEKVGMPLRLEEADHGLEGTRNWLTDQTEELAQLEKMYKADDLTEETEDIVLKRTRRDLERGKKGLDFQVRHDKELREIDLPRDHENLKIEARRTAAERDRVVAVTKLQLAQAALEIAKAKANLDIQERQFARLQADREKLALTAPEAGYAVPGSLQRGKWVNVDDMRRTLKKGGKLHANDVVFTIVKPGAVRVVATVPEAAMLSVRQGQDALVVPNVAGDLTLAAKVGPVSPVASGTEFDIALDLAQPDARLFPGYGCKVRIALGSRPAILVPASAVEDGFEKAVYVAGGAKPERRVVKTGATQDGKVEIVAGLAGGERVLETAPKK